jgi:hypothetical protein
MEKGEIRQPLFRRRCAILSNLPKKRVQAVCRESVQFLRIEAKAAEEPYMEGQ